MEYFQNKIRKFTFNSVQFIEKHLPEKENLKQQNKIKVQSERCNVRVGGEAEEHCDEVRGREHGACTE